MLALNQQRNNMEILEHQQGSCQRLALRFRHMYTVIIHGSSISNSLCAYLLLNPIIGLCLYNYTRKTTHKYVRNTSAHVLPHVFPR